MGTTVIKPPGPIIMMDQWEILSRSQVQFLHSFLEVHNCVRFTSYGKLHEFGAEKPISWANLAQFDFFTIKFTITYWAPPVEMLLHPHYIYLHNSGRYNPCWAYLIFLITIGLGLQDISEWENPIIWLFERKNRKRKNVDLGI
jgi:hypothetical protein